MDLKKNTLLVVMLLFSVLTYSQRIWEGEYNRLGLQAGVNQFNIHTGNFEVKGGTSWMVGFSNRASYFNDFQVIYGLSFLDFRAKVQGRERIEDPVADREIEYNMIGVQAKFLGSYKIIGNYLSVEAGPVIQVNGKFEPRQDKEFFFVEEYDILSTDIENVSVFNLNLAAGISGGFETFKVFAQYQYGINNFLRGLNNEDLESIDPRARDFSGNLSIITAGVIVFL